MKLKHIMIYLRRNSLDIAILIAVLSAFFVAGMVAWLSMISPEAEAINRRQKEYFASLQREYETPAGERAWKRLNRKHGYPESSFMNTGRRRILSTKTALNAGFSRRKCHHDD